MQGDEFTQFAISGSESFGLEFVCVVCVEVYLCDLIENLLIMYMRAKRANVARACVCTIVVLYRRIQHSFVRFWLCYKLW